MYIKGVVYDVGRDQGNNEKFYANMIIRLADYGYNMLLLNLKYRFHFSSHPELAMPDSLTPDMAKRLDKVAMEHGIQLVPIVNCGGHSDGVGLTDKYNSLCADEYIKDPGNPGVGQLRINRSEAEKFILECYADLYDSFSCDYFHIGADELFRLDKIYPELEQDKRLQEAVKYFNRIIADVKAHGKIPMMWGDMLLKHPGVVDLLDKDVIVCDWAYFSSPQSKPLSNRKSMSVFKQSGYKTVFANSAATFNANPLLCDQSTMNIVFGTREYNEIFGEEAAGVITTVWETQYGSCFDVVWPWLYLQSRIHRGEKRDERSLDFLSEYTALEWGLPEKDDSLKRWYQLVDIGFTKMVLYEAFLDRSMNTVMENNKQRPYKMLRMFFTYLFSNRNVLPIINTERREWIKPVIRKQMEEIYGEALTIAESMAERSVRRKEESCHLVQFNQVLLSVTELVGLEEALEITYHEAARIQFVDRDGFLNLMTRLKDIYLDMANCMDVLAGWLDVLRKDENYAADACVMTPLAAEDLRERAENILKIAEANVPLVSYQRFIRRDSDLPMMRNIGRDRSR